MLVRAAAAAGAALTAAALIAPTALAQASCPGLLPAGSPCVYTSVQQVGDRSGGTLRFPQAVAVGPDGAVYVADQKSRTIQAFNADGTFRRDFGTYGTKAGQLISSGGVAVAPDNTLFVLAGQNHIDHWAQDGTLIKSFGRTGSGVGEFSFGGGGGNDGGAGGGIAVGPDNFLYIADTGNDRIQRFNTDFGQGSVIVPAGTVQYPMGIAIRKTRLYVADDQHHRITVHDTGGKLLKTIGSGEGDAPGQLQNPYDVAVDPSGRVFVADDLNHRVVRFNTLPNYTYKARWGAYGQVPGRLAFPRGIATDASGLIYVANTGNDRIDVFDNSGTLLRSMGKSGRVAGQFDEPTGVAVDASGVTLVTDNVNGRVQLLDAAGKVMTVWGSPNPGPTILRDPVATAFDGAGNAYVLDKRRSKVIVFSRATGTPVREIGALGSGPGKLMHPSALTVTPGGTILVADTDNERIERFQLNGSVLEPWTQVGRATGIASSPDGQRIYVSTASDHRIRVYDPQGTELDEFGGNGQKIGKLIAPQQIATDAAGNVWVADRGNSRIQKFGPNGERLAAFGKKGTGPGEFILPSSVAVDCHGTVTVADFGNNRVQRFALAEPAPGGCASLPAPATPTPPKVYTLPEPEGAVITASIERRTGLLKQRSLVVRVSCDTRCTLQASGTLTPTAQPPKPKKKGARRPRPTVVALKPVTKRLGAGQISHVRLTLTAKNAAALKKALRGRRSISGSISLTATADAGEPTQQTLRLDGRP